MLRTFSFLVLYFKSLTKQVVCNSILYIKVGSCDLTIHDLVKFYVGDFDFIYWSLIITARLQVFWGCADMIEGLCVYD